MSPNPSVVAAGAAIAATGKYNPVSNRDEIPMPQEPHDDDPDSGFWSQREVLAHIYAFARSRRVAPYAVLASVLRRAISCVGPNVKLPPTVGGYASLNLFVAAVGRSGQGKGAADAAGYAAVFFPGPDGEALDAPSPGIGTGEGLARLFKGGKGQEPITRANMSVAEVSTLEALAGRQGATLAGQLLSAYMGEPLGFQNSNIDTTTAIPAHSYRLCLGVGVQPENAGFFLSREKDGFPQRFLWASTVDPYAPEIRPEPVEPIDVMLPTFSTADHIIRLPRTVWEEVDRYRHLVLIGSPDVDPLDGHLNLTRLKVSYALALLDGRKDLSDSDWKISGELIDVSTRTRNGVRRVIEERRRTANRARAHEQAEREVIVSELLTEDRQKRAAKSVLRKLARVHRATRRELRDNCASELRTELDAVLGIMVEQGTLALSPGQSSRRDVFEVALK